MNYGKRAQLNKSNPFLLESFDNFTLAGVKEAMEPARQEALAAFELYDKNEAEGKVIAKRISAEYALERRTSVIDKIGHFFEDVYGKVWDAVKGTISVASDVGGLGVSAYMTVASIINNWYYYLLGAVLFIILLKKI